MELGQCERQTLVTQNRIPESKSMRNIKLINKPYLVPLYHGSTAYHTELTVQIIHYIRTSPSTHLSLPNIPTQSPHLHRLLLPRRSLPPSSPPIPRLELSNLDLCPLRRPSNLPITLAIHISLLQCQHPALVTSIKDLLLLLGSLLHGFDDGLGDRLAE